MALGKKKSSNSGEKKGSWRSLGTIWESDKFDGQYIGLQKPDSDYYPGDLIFQDKKTKKFYRVKQISLFEPRDGAPKAAIMNLVLNLDSEYHVEELSDDNSEQEAEE